MSGDEPQGDRHVRLTDASTKQFFEWAKDASDEDYALAREVLFQVVEGTWRRECEYSQDVVHSLTWDIQVRPGLIMSVRFAKEYPTMAQLIFIGLLPPLG